MPWQKSLHPLIPHSPLIIMKKIAIILLTVLFSQTTFAAYENSINFLKDGDLLPGEMELETNWNEIITTTEFYAMLVAFSETELSSEIELPYLDTTDSSWYAPYVQTALDRDILRPSLYTPKLLPNRHLRRRGVITKLFDTLGVGVDKFFDKSDFPFTDITAEGTFSPYAYKAYQLGILTSEKAGAARTVSKGYVAYMLDKISEFKEGNGEVTVMIQNGTDFNSTERTLINNEAFDVLLDIWSAVQKEYYYQDEIDETEMIYEAIDGIVNYLEDPYTVFSKPKQSNAKTTLNTNYEGVGMSVEVIDGNITIISPFKNSPAEKAGLKPNDIITKIDGQSIEGMTIEEAVDLIKGPAGSAVKLTIKRNSTLYMFSVTREAISYKTASVYFEEEAGKTVAVVDLRTFSENTYNEMVEAATEINDTTGVDGIILDLRNNPGGYLNIAIDIAQMFFTETKDIVMLEDNDGKKTIYHSSTEGGELADYEVVVLVNEGSASASEILAGAIHDWNRGKLIGTQTFGKGTVQELSFYKSGAAFKLTVSKWLTPKGSDINKQGITPDQIVENTDTKDWQLDTALEEF